ncbi:hypothetical protein [Clostridium sp.]|jgi:hypothetical protein|uniref:hypothetical protein n=1 Tax=Clostridium sp. TaxID=1506 RepID=UPI0028510E28|nr:hypothetical protein [Clostridium sp.]MDR3596394.1 hypothetical protein [Clostridium sp.]
MSRCPFWSTKREKIECYNECPILGTGSLQGEGNEKCVFHECSEESDISFRDSIKDEYSFLNLLIYDEEKSLNISY